MTQTFRRSRRATDSGFTLIELVVVMSIVGILASTGIFGFTSWRDTAQQQGTADELVSTLRTASTRAVSEGRTYCVAIAADGRTYSQWRYACDTTTGTQVATATVQASAVSLAATVPTTGSMPSGAVCPPASRCLYFYPRGTAVPAAVTVSSTERPSKTYTVRVEGLTSRVHQQ